MTFKMLVIPSWYASDERPTLGSFFREQAEAVEACGADVRVAYCELRHPVRRIKDLFYRKKKGLVISQEGRIPTYRFIRYNLFNKTPETMDRQFAEGLNRIIEYLIADSWKPDIIHLQSFFPAGYGVLDISEKYGIPFVLTEHSTGFSRHDWSTYQEHNLRRILNKAASIVTVSRGLKNDVAHYTDKNITVIPNLVDFSKFQNRTASLPFKNKFVFFSLGYLTHKKGFDILIRAFSLVFKGVLDVELRIGGDGIERNMLKKLAKELGIIRQVTFLGALSREQVAKEMNDCHAFVLASRFETFGVVFIEALSAGKPIIVPDIDGPNDIVNENNGLVFKYVCESALSKSLKVIQENYDSYSSKDIKLHCFNTYDKTVVGNKIYRLMKESIKNNESLTKF